ncbi:MAG: hypothetical protein AB2541_11720, partial [Candidatus Thiodiazotropha sp.]
MKLFATFLTNPNIFWKFVLPTDPEESNRKTISACALHAGMIMDVFRQISKFGQKSRTFGASLA